VFSLSLLACFFWVAGVDIVLTMTEKPPMATIAPLEQFILLSKSAKGAAAVELIKQVTEANGVYVFGELLDMPNIKEVT
jgi:hypothetical protein